MTLALLDLASSPPCVVLVTDDGQVAEETAQKYANQTGRVVTVIDGHSSPVAPGFASLVGGPRMLAAADFASAADARRAGFNVPDPVDPEPLKLLPSSGDEGKKGTSGDVPEDRKPPKASK